MKKQYNKTWSILIYTLIIVGIVLTVFSFIASQAFNNLWSLSAIKKSFNLYVSSIGNYEEKIVDYLDDPIYNKNFNDTYSISISRYKKFIEWFTNKDYIYILGLTDSDNEYSNSLKSLKYLDLFWNEKDLNKNNLCDLDASLLKWPKSNDFFLLNKKNLLEGKTNYNLVSSYFKNSATIEVFFSTWVIKSSGSDLDKDDFNISSWSIVSITWSIDKQYFTLNLSWSFSDKLMECNEQCLSISVKEGWVKTAYWGNTLNSETIPIRKNLLKYLNRFRITDSLSFLNTKENNFFIFLKSNNFCFFWLEWFDKNNTIIYIPDTNAEWKINLYDQKNPLINKQKTFIKNFYLWNSSYLSNYLYKLY